MISHLSQVYILHTCACLSTWEVKFMRVAVGVLVSQTQVQIQVEGELGHTHTSVCTCIQSECCSRLLCIKALACCIAFRQDVANLEFYLLISLTFASLNSAFCWSSADGFLSDFLFPAEGSVSGIITRSLICLRPFTARSCWFYQQKQGQNLCFGLSCLVFFFLFTPCMPKAMKQPCRIPLKS